MTVYENLFCSMKNSFTVVKNNREYTLGSYLKEKAGEKAKKTSLALSSRGENALTHNSRFLERRLTVTKAPSPEKTLTAFPLRTATTALISAAALCLCISPIARLLNRAESEPAQTISVAVVTEPTELSEDALYSTVNL